MIFCCSHVWRRRIRHEQHSEVHDHRGSHDRCVLLFCGDRIPPPPAGVADANASPIYGVTIPLGYRQWELVAPSHEAGNLDELRSILGNGIAMKAYREETLPFPEGTILAKLAWKHVASPIYDDALGAPQAFVPGRATTLQFMVKDSKKYASGGLLMVSRLPRHSTRRVSPAMQPT
jgi:hypothetical protein